MKRLFHTILFTAFFTPAVGQNLSAGVNFGTALTRSGFSIAPVNGDLSQQRVNGYTTGIDIKFYANKHWFTGAGFHRTNKGYKLSLTEPPDSLSTIGGSHQTEIGMTHTVIPLYFGYYKKLGSRWLWDIAAGGSLNHNNNNNLPQFGTGINGSTGYIRDTVIIVRPTAVNIHLQTGIAFKFKRNSIYSSIIFSKGLTETFITNVQYGYNTEHYTAQLSSKGSYVAFIIGYSFSFDLGTKSSPGDSTANNPPLRVGQANN